MIKDNNAQLEMIDDIYSLAFWLTGSKKDASKLLKKTYLNTANGSSKMELIKKFRSCYFESIGQAPVSGFIETLDQSEASLKKSLWTWLEDIKLTVLLAEIPGLKHRDIGEITGNTLETIRLWLFWGRKQLINGRLLNYSPWPKTAIKTMKSTVKPQTVPLPLN